MHFSIETLVVLASLTSSALAASRTTAPAGAIVVSKSKAPGTFLTVQAALNSLDNTTKTDQSIFIDKGTYNEQVFISPRKNILTIYGYTTDTSSYQSNGVTIVAGGSQDSGAANDDQTATMRAWAAGLKVYNINLVNTRGSGPGTGGGQALALSAQKEKQGYYGVQLIGYQDTLYAKKGAQVYAKSLIAGAVDFIFGTAEAWIDNSDIRAVGPGTVTASGRVSDSDPAIIVVNKCTIAAASSYSGTSMYLGRPWRNYARAVFQNSLMSNVVPNDGWQAWQPEDPRTSTTVFQEIGNSGAGSVGPRKYEVPLKAAYTIDQVLGADYKSWVDTSYLSK